MSVTSDWWRLVKKGTIFVYMVEHTECTSLMWNQVRREGVKMTPRYRTASLNSYILKHFLIIWASSVRKNQKDLAVLIWGKINNVRTMDAVNLVGTKRRSRAFREAFFFVFYSCNSYFCFSFLSMHIIHIWCALRRDINIRNKWIFYVLII